MRLFEVSHAKKGKKGVAFFLKQVILEDPETE